MTMRPVYDVVGYMEVRRMHWIYFIFIGWGLGLCMASLIFPLFFAGGRRFVAACFGYW